MHPPILPNPSGEGLQLYRKSRSQFETTEAEGNEVNNLGMDFFPSFYGFFFSFLSLFPFLKYILILRCATLGISFPWPFPFCVYG